MISVIIPVYNEEPFIERCLDSVAHQTDKSAQIIIVDDGSTDRSGKICEEYGKKYGFEVYHLQNGGVSRARNFGIEKVKGEYLTFLDSDDAYEEDAIEKMTQLTQEHSDSIIMFGHYRHHKALPEPSRRAWPEGNYDYTNFRRHWQMVWNKVFKTSFIQENDLRFIEGMQFGEDELFIANALLKSGGLYHSRYALVHHHFDNHNSLCRGSGLTLQRLERMDDEENRLLRRLKMGNAPMIKRRWLKRVIERNRHSPFFQEHGFSRGAVFGANDIVYFVKEAPENEELRYSLRSVEKFFPHRNVCFFGGCPDGIKPDRHIKVVQDKDTKWDNVRAMIRAVCENDELTEDVWFFNDDFFIMQPFDENSSPTYNGDLYRHIVRVEDHHGQITSWTMRLRGLAKALNDAGKGTLNYEVHKPMLINRKKALEVLKKFPSAPGFRSLYGNYWEVGGVNQGDRKCQVLDFPVEKLRRWKTISSDDKSFREGTVGQYIRDQFKEKSRFEF